MIALKHEFLVNYVFRDILYLTFKVVYIESIEDTTSDEVLLSMFDEEGEFICSLSQDEYNYFIKEYIIALK